MSGLKKYFPDVRMGGNMVSPDEMDMYQQYVITNPTISATYVGTCAGGTATVAKPLVITNGFLDYPRNLLYSCVGTNDMGGTWTVNGKDQFGNTISETVTNGTVTAGTPAFAVAGTKIFAQVTSGTFTATSTAVGAGSARLGVAVGASGTTQYWLGLPNKINAVTDVKTITFTSQGVGTAINGGTVQSATYVSTATHAINCGNTMAGTEVYSILHKPTYNLEAQDQARL